MIRSTTRTGVRRRGTAAAVAALVALSLLTAPTGAAATPADPTDPGSGPAAAAATTAAAPDPSTVSSATPPSTTSPSTAAQSAAAETDAAGPADTATVTPGSPAPTTGAATGTSPATSPAPTQTAATQVLPTRTATPLPELPTSTTPRPTGLPDRTVPLPGAALGDVLGDRAPVGATDGIPVGGDERPTRITVPRTLADVPSATVAAAAQRRYFGSGPWTAISTAAAATNRCTGLTPDALRAMVVAPIFKESAGGTTPDSAPSPMTLSRYDEWSGVRNGSTNSNANYGLYAFRDPNTPFTRAWWHPGIGIWQYDTAGVGAPFTAAERMDVSVIARDVAAGMADRWCSPGPWIGSKASYTLAERRAAAWAPWWYTDNGGCPLCEQAYQDMAPGTSAAFANVSTVPMDVAGGASRRSCRLAGVAGTVTCWYIDPSKAQGANWWAGLTPLDGGSPTDYPTPLSAPFYDVEIGGQERRYWISADTGYTVDLSGSRTLGKNDRPKTNQPGSGISWSSGSVLCDLTGRRGSCDPSVPPPGVASSPLSITLSDHALTALDADGDGRGDVLFHRPDGDDTLWLGRGNGTFSASHLQLDAGCRIVVADIDGDGADDIVCYTARTGRTLIYRPRTRVLSVHALLPSATVFAVDPRGTGQDDLVFYRGAPQQSWQLTWTGASFRVAVRQWPGGSTPLVGDFDGNSTEDVFWYGPGSRPDRLVLNALDGREVTVPVTVSGTYRTAVGDLDGDRRDDIVFYGPGTAADSVWFGGARGVMAKAPLSMGGSYVPTPVDLPRDGRTDIMWFGPGSTPDFWSRWSAGRTLTTSVAGLSGYQRPLVGRFSAGGGDGILWYGPGSVSDWIWYQTGG